MHSGSPPSSGASIGAAAAYLNGLRVTRKSPLGDEVAVSGATSGGQEMDHADTPLAGSAEPLHDPLAGTNAGTGESSVMKRDLYSAGQGKERLPLQPHPKNKTRAVYTEELTHLTYIDGSYHAGVPSRELVRRAVWKGIGESS